MAMQRNSGYEHSGFQPVARSRGANSRGDWSTAFRDRCEGYGVPYIDTHCHIDYIFRKLKYKGGTFSQFIKDNSKSFPSTFEGCLAVFCDPETFTPEGGLWERLSQERNVWAAMGCHPKSAVDYNDKVEDKLRQCLKHPNVIAAGEMGLDYSGMFKELAEIQKEAFTRQLLLAVEIGKPLVIHSRDSDEDCIDLMEKLIPHDYKIHCHCFTRNFEMAKRWLDKFPNLYIGLTPLVTYKSAVEVHDVALHIPLDKLLLETDSPYFVPHKVVRNSMKFSHPGLAVTVAETVAEIRGVPVTEVLRHCRENTRNMYGI